MLDYTAGNYLTFGYGGRVFGDKQVGDSVQYNFTPCTRTPGSFQEECRRTAELIYQQAVEQGREVYVLVSGGLDSVAMVKGFVEAGIPFKTATYSFKHGLSEHELEHVRDLVQLHSLNHTYLEIDAEAWLVGSEAHEWFHKTNCCELGTLPLMKLMQHVSENLNGLPVFGGGDIDVIKENGVWFYSRFESFLSRYWFSERFGLSAFISFFQHTPEIVLSALQEPEICKAGMGLDSMANAVLNELKIVKYRAMHRIWPGLKRRPKWGGTEQIHHKIIHTELAWQKERQVRFDETWKVPFADFVKSLQALEGMASC